MKINYITFIASNKLLQGKPPMWFNYNLVYTKNVQSLFETHRTLIKVELAQRISLLVLLSHKTADWVNNRSLLSH